MTARREMTLALAGCATAGGLALSASAQRWLTVTITRPRPLPPVVETLTGGQAAPLVTACGLLLLAAAVAVPAVRGAGRVAVGLLVAAAGAGLGWSGVRGLTGALTDAAAVDAAGRIGGGTEISGAAAAGWPAVAVAAGLVALLAGLLVAVRGRAWPGMGRRYERAGSATTTASAAAATGRPQTPEDRHQAAWQALDRGEDPTVDAPVDALLDPAGDGPGEDSGPGPAGRGGATV
ncbi:Trp biosynthesis-associated membrane protein [Modestobacter lapidis]|nr:Trp biosynthesis-associated membrane protein [Modestobacter lapidis]